MCVISYLLLYVRRVLLTMCMYQIFSLINNMPERCLEWRSQPVWHGRRVLLGHPKMQLTGMNLKTSGSPCHRRNSWHQASSFGGQCVQKFNVPQPEFVSWRTAGLSTLYCLLCCKLWPVEGY